MKIVLSVFLACSSLFIGSCPILAGESGANSSQGWTTTRERTVVPRTNGYSGSDKVTRTNARGGQVVIERSWQTDGQGNVEYESNHTRTTRNGRIVESEHQGQFKFSR